MKRRLKQIVPAVCIVGIIAVISFALYKRVIAREEERCWQVLSESAEAVNREVSSKFQDEIETVTLIAERIVAEDRIDREGIRRMDLDRIEKITIFSRIDVLYPDGTLLLQDGTVRAWEGADSFDEIAARGAHMSERYTDFITGRECVKYCIPLVQEGKVQAIFMAVVDAGSLSDVFVSYIYQGQANCVIIDSSDGSFIMDAWHEELGNHYTLGDRKRVKGYEDINLDDDVRNRRTGVIAFESRTTGIPSYMYYMPLDVFDWELEIFVQENIVFEDVYYLKKLLMAAGAAEALLLLLYLLWNVYKVHQLEKSKEETERQLENSNTLIQCVTELSSDKDIHVLTHNLLGIVNRHFGADRTYVFEADFDKDTLVSTDEYTEQNMQALSGEEQEQFISDMKQWIEHYERLLPEEIPSSVTIEKAGTERCRLIPLCKNNTTIGFVGIDNAKKHREETDLLSSIQYFITNSMFRQKKHERLSYMSYRDMLTSLYNRNKYIQFLEENAGEKSKRTGVLFVDLNGLKQINDSQSHEAGDSYIRRAAHNVSAVFANQAYRIGGDEFVVIEQSIAREEFLEKAEKLKQRMQEENVSASIGFLWREECADLEKMLGEAEQQMYREKEVYYQTHERYMSER